MSPCFKCREYHCKKSCSWSDDCEICGFEYREYMGYRLECWDKSMHINNIKNYDERRDENDINVVHKDCNIHKCCGTKIGFDNHREWCVTRIPKTNIKHNWIIQKNDKYSEVKVYKCTKCLDTLELDNVYYDNNYDLSYYLNIDILHYVLTYCRRNNVYLSMIADLEKEKEKLLIDIKNIDYTIEDYKKKHEEISRNEN